MSAVSAPPFIVAALYQFRTVPDPAALQERLLALGQEAGLCGTLIVAHEGLNGTVAGTRGVLTACAPFCTPRGLTGWKTRNPRPPSGPLSGSRCA
ncbi:hypothetical protein [Deinococcus multiflagellatus]|uniref:tRNA uridine(34) hydroxylase N-terminal domain-containing protein n=1 Tax=Deinococcus multiflagellatus TaxID=1656887 RepID=A0ABW1ZE06_9DEIO